MGLIHFPTHLDSRQPPITVPDTAPAVFTATALDASHEMLFPTPFPNPFSIPFVGTSTSTGGHSKDTLPRHLSRHRSLCLSQDRWLSFPCALPHWQLTSQLIECKGVRIGVGKFDVKCVGKGLWGESKPDPTKALAKGIENEVVRGVEQEVPKRVRKGVELDCVHKRRIVSHKDANE